ncbi:hypothetical protein TRIATDRAFT_83147 [Trichoderma atroviride IMI 206040]|uniref:Zn(2)-C6 fungal-type domain-containing protein n=1 Tax=Hypocrea atroviridis (strain ATCC 20476 / IMI 206040) TaxID=452589 RepID=G9NGU3_HYPAI|nr:uncharacterized protein TRIATDRAFT_83147 [Trichoderma atroviride IMI 206040]EHK49842.1 hypothetical protein TRIATDRAFT_83147 [Trichoderma atroviride IMI 206040]
MSISISTTSEETLLPFRRSCDRCHDQKVRCIRSQGESHPTIASEQCVRCKKSGAICVYSPQQKPGRPPLCSEMRDTVPSTVNHRKRPPQSPEPAYLSRLSPASCPPSANSLHNPASADNSLPVNPALFSPFTMADALVDTSSNAYEADFLIGVSGMPPIESLSPTSRQKCFFPEGPTLESFVDQTERDTEELGNLSLRVCRLNKALSSSYPSSLSISSPCLNDIFISSEILVGIIHRNVGGKYGNKADSFVPDTGPHGFDLSASWEDVDWLQQRISERPVVSPPADRRMPDTGIVLMILACHQRLLTTLGGILFYISRHLRQQQPSKRPLGTSQFLEMPTTQAIINVKLVSHQLQRLDHAVGLLGDNGASKNPIRSNTARVVASSNDSLPSSRSSGSPLSTHGTAGRGSLNKSKDVFDDEDSEHESDISSSSASSGSHKAISSALTMMKRRHEHLQRQITTVKQLIRQFDSI